MPTINEAALRGGAEVGGKTYNARRIKFDETPEPLAPATPLEAYALEQMKARAQYNAMVQREVEAGRVPEGSFPTYKIQPNRATRRRILAQRKKQRR